MFFADVDRFAALPASNRIDVMQRIAVDVRSPLPSRCYQPEPGWRNPDFLQNLPDQGFVEALVRLNAPTDRIPMARPGFLCRRPQAEKHFAIRPDQQCAHSP